MLQAGDEVQIVIHLIDATTDTHAWAESWTRPAGGMLAVLNEISHLVASRVRSELQGHERTFGPKDSLQVGNVTAIHGRGSEILIGGEFAYGSPSPARSWLARKVFGQQEISDS